MGVDLDELSRAVTRRGDGRGPQRCRIGVVADAGDRQQPVDEVDGEVGVGRAAGGTLGQGAAFLPAADAEEAADALEDLSGAQAGHRHQPVGDDGPPDGDPIVDEGEHGGSVDRCGDGERECVRGPQRLEEAAGLDGTGDVGGDLVVVAGNDEAGTGDRFERRPPGADHAEHGLAGKERAVDAEELEGVGPPGGGVQVAQAGPPGQAHLARLVASQ